MRRRFGTALIIAAGAPVGAAVLFVVHLQLWVRAAQQHGLETTDWGFAIVFAFIQVMLAGCAALAAGRAWVHRSHRPWRMSAAFVIALLVAVAGLLSLAGGPHYLISDVPCVVALVGCFAAAVWLLVAAWRED